MKHLVLAIALLFAVAPSVSASSYETTKLHGQVLTAQVNQARSPADLRHMYLLSKVADARAAERASERNATGTSEFPHDVGRAAKALTAAGVCWKNVGEVVGFSSTLPTSSTAALADGMVDRWWASGIHRSVLNNAVYNRGGGGWARANNGTYFFVYYTMDPC